MAIKIGGVTVISDAPIQLQNITNLYNPASAGTTGQVLTSNGTTTPTWSTPVGAVSSVAGRTGVVTLAQADITGLTTASTPTFSTVTATTFYGSLIGTANQANALMNGSPGSVPYSLANGSSSWTAVGTTGQVLSSNAAGAPTWITLASANIAGGVFGSIPYQSAAGVTSLLAPGTSGQILSSNGSGSAPTWIAAPSGGGSGGATITDDISTNLTHYLGMSRASSGSWTTAYTSSTKLYFNPSTGILAATIFQSLSDETQKTDIVDITNAVDTVNQLEGVEFNWIDNNKKSAGVIAQQLESILPHLVETSGSGLKSVNYAGIIGYLIEAVKELSERVIELEAK